MNGYMRKIIKEKLNKKLNEEEVGSLMLNNNNKLNKNGANTIYLGDNPIADFGVGDVGSFKIKDHTFENALYLSGGFTTSQEGKGYGKMAINFLFNRLPKIDKLVIKCYYPACGFWEKMGGKVVDTEKIEGSEKSLNLMVVPQG